MKSFQTIARRTFRPGFRARDERAIHANCLGDYGGLIDDHLAREKSAIKQDF